MYFMGWGEENFLLGEVWDFGKKSVGYRVVEKVCGYLMVVGRLVERKRVYMVKRVIERMMEEEEGKEEE